MERLRGAVLERARAFGLGLDPGEAAGLPSELLLEYLVELEPTAACQQVVDDLAAKLTESQAADAELGEERVSRRTRQLVLAHDRARWRLADCRARDQLVGQRPEGCWCLGLGGRYRAAIVVDLPSEPGARRVRPALDADGEPLVGWREYCGCLEGQAQQARADRARMAASVRQRQEQVEQRWRGAGIEAHFRGLTLETYLAAIGPSAEPLVVKLDTWLDAGDGWLVLWGQPGRGKTGLAMALASELADRGRSVLVRAVPDLLDRLRQTYGGHGSEPELEAALLEVELLVLDDLGADRATDWATEKLFKLLHARHGARRRTVITTNLDPTALAAHVSERTWERIREMTGRAGVLQVSGPNLRDRTP